MADGASIAIEVDDAAVKSVLARVAAVDADTTSLMTEFGAAVFKSTRWRFETRSAPGGAAWARLAPRTVRERIRLGYGAVNILRREGYLYESLTYVASADRTEVGTNNPYALPHQFGVTVEHPARTQTIYQNYDAKTDTFDPRFRKKSQSNFARDVAVGAYRVRIPARPYLGVDADDVVELTAIGDAWLAERIGGGR